MTEFVGQCSKVYGYRIGQVEFSHNKAKGVSSRNLTIEHYKNVLLSGASLYGNRTMFRSKAHKITTVKVNKKIATNITKDMFIFTDTNVVPLTEITCNKYIYYFCKIFVSLEELTFLGLIFIVQCTLLVYLLIN